MRLPRPQWLCFDLDGTLVDSVPDITQSVNVMLSEMQLTPVTTMTVRDWIGQGAAKLIERALCYSLAPSKVSEYQIKRGHELFFEAYRNNTAEQSQLFPGCLSTLEYFQDWGTPMACVTNKPRQFTQPLLAAMKLDIFFHTTVCGDDLAVKKPDPQPLLHAIEQLSGQPQRGYMIGDSDTDMKTAARAGTGAIYVTYGYNRGINVDEYKPIVVRELSQLTQLFG